MKYYKILNFLIIAIVSMTAFISILSAGNNNEPEISDEQDDVIGTLIEKPNLLIIFQRFGIIDFESYDFMDIISASFYENSNEPEYLFAEIKIKELEHESLRVIYAIRWEYNEKFYGVTCHSYSNGNFIWFAAGRIFGLFDNLAYKNDLIQDISDCEFNTNSDSIIFKIPKDLIGNPQSGDILTNTNGWTGLRFVFEPFTYLFGGELAIDPTSIGNDYIIKY